ncbi:MAG: Nif-specific regulatory protein, partial [Chloroflexota bacterium]|nr:Nif-specific regulatory protein [Chloroflexota bacterium]
MSTTAASYAAELQAQYESTSDPRQLLAWTLGWLAGSLRFKGGSIARLTGDELEIVAAFGQIDEAARRVKLRRGEGIAGSVVATGQVIYNPDIASRTPGDTAAAGRDVGTNRLIRSYLCAPLVSGGQVIGVMQIDSDRTGAFDPDAVRLFGSVADALSASEAL